MKATIISLIFGLIIITGAVIYSNNGQNGSSSVNADNVRVENGKQIVEIRARGGYLPRRSIAKADIPTTIRFNTSGTFDCSASVRIPSLGISKLLPQSGSTDIDIGQNKIGTLRGSCGMGMYPFEIEFR